MAEVLLEREGPIAWFRMNRAEAHNAFSRDMMALMAKQVSHLAEDPDARVAILCAPSGRRSSAASMPANSYW